jgi:outer membrane biogenesis lipoprotein LolB
MHKLVALAVSILTACSQTSSRTSAAWRTNRWQAEISAMMMACR